MMDYIQAEHPRPNHFILHMSDTHLVGGSDPLYGSVDSEARLREVFDGLEASGSQPEAIVFTGDPRTRGSRRRTRSCARSSSRPPGASGPR
jgi:Icc protein